MDDCINRQVAIDAVSSIGYVAKLADGDAVIRLSAVNYVLDELPSAQSEPQWIPVTERLPEQKARVLTCSKYGDIWINDYNPIAPTAWAIEPWAVIAWMPMPEPWKGVTE